MRRMHWCTLAVLVPSLVLLAANAGCNGKKDGSSGDKKDETGAATKDAGATSGGEKKALAIKARGTLKGKVTVAGMPTGIEQKTDDLQAAIKKHKDGPKCMEGSKEETTQQDWRIGEGNGLAEVFVWLRPPDGQFFKLEKTDLELKDVKEGGWDIKAKELVLDQPHCAFIPHAFAVFSKYYDADSKTMKPTGQKLIVKNSADFPHNTNWKGSAKNRGDNKLIPAKGQIEVPALTPDDAPVTFKCDLHTWMQASSRVFDHPFVAVTDKDGNFEIKDVPAGVDVQVVAWHPASGYLAGGDKGEKITIKEGDMATKNFEAKAK